MCLITTSMTSRLDRLFILLETGANAATKRVAAQQLGEAQRLHPHELHHLLSRVSSLLKSTQWDTRIAAAHAVQAIISQVPVWDPQPLEKRLTNEGEETNKQNDHEEEKAKDEEEEFVSQKKITKKLSFDNFNMSQVFTQSLYLTGSEGSEYDHTLMETGTSSIPNEKMLAEKLGLHPHLLGVNTNELFTSDDFIANVPPAVPPIKPEKTIGETLEQNLGISRREMNRARRKARQSSSKQRSRESDDPVDNSSSNLDLVSVENPCKKVKLDSEVQTETSLSIDDYTIDPRCAVPDATGCWPDTAIVWPFEAFAENLLQDLFSLKWEVRHGAATAFRELIRLHGKGAGKSRNHTLEEMKESHRQWLIDAALRLLCILGIDRFGDYISDQVVAPVRETCAQALGSLVTLISSKTKKEIKVEENTSAENSENKSESDESSENYKQDIMGLLSIILKLSKHTEWEARHGALLALKYLLAIRSDLLKDILPVAFPAIMQGLSDFVEDVGAMAASALIPIASDLPKLLNPQQLETIILKLWQLLKEQDDLAAACNSFMGLLAAVLSLPSARAFLTPQPLSTILPRLFPFLSHSSSSVRKSTLETLETLVGDEKDNATNFEERWGEDDGAILQDTLQHVFQRILIEHIDKIQEIAERVWEKLVVQSDLKLLLVASCPLISTWLCLAMQPEHVPFNIDLFKNMTFQKASKGPAAPAELKIYMGGIETVPRNVRHFNVVRARCTAARMLGLLSVYIVKPMPGVVYSPELPSPSLCYAKVLLAHLHSRSALQRTFAALTMSHWATVDQNKPLEIPDCLRDQLFVCLNECIYYDEIASSVSRLLHESRDYVAMLKHYKLSFPMEINTEGVINLDQIAQLASISTTNLRVINPNDPTDTTSSKTKLKPKIVETLEERRRALEAGALASAAQQQALHITAMAALAGAATMLECLPEPPQPLNPLVKPLMESIKREEDEELQKLSARHLAHLVSLCVNRTPCPNTKIAMNLSIFLCSDSEFTPRIDISNKEDFFYDGIVTLTNRHKQAERSAYNRTNSSGITINRGPGRPPATDIPKEDLLACDEPEAKAARTKRQGATAALTAIVTLLGERLSETLPQLWNTILPENLRNYNAEKFMTVEEANQLICDLQVMEVVMRNLDKSLLLPIMSCLENLCLLLTNAFKYVRHMASRCLAILVSLKTKETMDVVVEKIIAFLETRNPSDVTSKSVANPNEINASRQGASEALACLVETLGVNIVPYAVRFMVPLLGRMSDQNQAVRLTCSSTFATLVQLLPLDPRALDTSQKIENKDKEHQFLEQLLSPQNIPDTQLTVPVAASLRSYQQQGLNWLNFLNRYQLHGVLCDDMGLGKTLQTLCILALDHDRNKQAPTSLVICPPTLTGHWVYEAEKFFNAKDLSVIQYAGNPTERKKLRSRVLKHKLAVASYYIVRKDIEFFQEIQWNYCVLDEGHIIKNGKTKSAKAVKKLHAHHRLILSGTPVQNNVLELWSLFDFLMPGFLGSEKQFAAKYSRPILACREPKAGPKEQEAGALAMEALHRQALPFLLRRNKEDVLKDLPPKITQDYYCDLSVIQKTLYEDFRTKHSSNILNSATSSGNSHGHVFEALRYLRNVCNHPRLVVTPKHPLCQTIANILAQQNSTLYDIEQAAKLPALKQLLLDCGIGQANNQQYQNSIGSSSVSASSDNQQQQINLVSQHRALIFCQLKAMLDIVEQDLLQKHLQNVTYLRLDGGVPAAQRHSIVTRFNSDPSIDILLLTTQVGGLGLNLTGADTVIFIEHDWNPMKDLQAMDRAHRIGQKKVVNVYRLITRNTLEEKIMGLQKFKLLTANTIISTENNSLNTMKTEQLLDLFSLESTKTRSNSSVVENQNETNFVGLQGVNRSVLEMLPDLWEQQQYDDEYDLDSFLSTLQNTT